MRLSQWIRYTNVLFIERFFLFGGSGSTFENKATIMSCELNATSDDHYNWISVIEYKVNSIFI